MEVLDTHIHLTCRGYPPHLPNSWLGAVGSKEPGSYYDQDDWGESELRAAVATAANGFSVSAVLYIQCFNETPLDEARWILGLVRSPSSLVCGLVAHIPVPEGAAAVNAFQDQLRPAAGAALPGGLKGGRIFGAAGTLTPLYQEGLGALAARGLSWDFGGCPIPEVTQSCRNHPTLIAVLDHFGFGGTTPAGADKTAWEAEMAELARDCPNCYVKVGSMFDGGTPDAAFYFDAAIRLFGFERLLAESNWFVGTSNGTSSYDECFQLLLDACDRAGGTEDQRRLVFADNARRCYKLPPTSPSSSL
eukprot:COSAG01_NODE_5263_length_4376_cov_3.153612_4_plen_304_part_00